MKKCILLLIAVIAIATFQPVEAGILSKYDSKSIELKDGRRQGRKMRIRKIKKKVNRRMKKLKKLSKLQKKKLSNRSEKRVIITN